MIKFAKDYGWEILWMATCIFTPIIFLLILKRCG
jgi:hypothetical protein